LPDDDELPVMNVSWNDAVAFCEWLTRKEGVRYRLPTEAEWEYACRAGTSTPYFWGDDDARRDAHAWSAANAGPGPHPVGRLRPNAWGLYDTNGNVYEYCSDLWSPTAYQAGLLVDPAGPTLGDEIVVRGASWGTRAIHCRSAFRGSAPKDHRNRRDGFRVVREWSNESP
jgi:formylglycine-generating enzyme required for sulfatase activity